MPRHVVGGLGERAERAGEGTGGESGEAGDERGHERSRDEVGGEVRLGVVVEPVGPVPHSVTDRLLDGVQIVDEHGHRGPPGAGVGTQRGAVGGVLRPTFVGGGALGVLGREGLLQGRALGCGGELPEARQGGDAGGADLGEGEVLTAVEGSFGEHAVEEPAFEGDGLLGRGQLLSAASPSLSRPSARVAVRATGSTAFRASTAVVKKVSVAARSALPPVGSSADAGETSQTLADDALDGALAAHRAQRRVDARARGGQRRAELLLTAQQAVGQAPFALQLVHQGLDPQAESDLGAGRPGVAEGLGPAVHGETGDRQQQADRNRDDHRHPAPDTAPAGHRPYWLPPLPHPHVSRR